jgi:hypothetical protein
MKEKKLKTKNYESQRTKPALWQVVVKVLGNKTMKYEEIHDKIVSKRLYETKYGTPVNISSIMSTINVYKDKFEKLKTTPIKIKVRKENGSNN